MAPVLEEDGTEYEMRLSLESKHLPEDIPFNRAGRRRARRGVLAGGQSSRFHPPDRFRHFSA